MRRAPPEGLLALLLLFGGGIPACGTEGPEGFFVDLHGVVVDGDGLPVEGASVVFAAEDSAAIGEAVTGEDGRYSLPVFASELVDHQLRVQVSAEGSATTYAWFTVNLRGPEPQELRIHPNQSWSSWEQVLPPLRLVQEGGAAQVEGELVDAITGEPVPGASLELRLGYDAPDEEPPTAEVEGGSLYDSGAFSFQLEPGVYTLRVPAFPGYADARYPLYVPPAGRRGLRIPLSPPVAETEMRVALSWGDAPANLDLHLTGPRAVAQEAQADWERYHVWEDSPVHPENAPAGEVVAELERSDDDGSGPETIHVYTLRDSGDYRFSAFDASNPGGDASALAASDAVIQVWVGAGSPAFYCVPPLEAGNTWHAAAFDAEERRYYLLGNVDVVADESNTDDF